MGWHTPDVAHVQSPVIRWSASPDLATLVDRWADAAHLPRDEAVELLIRSRLAKDDNAPAVQAWHAYRDGLTQTPGEVADTLAAARVTEHVVGVRMGPLRPEATPPPWARPGIGVDLDADAMTAWPQIRGLWRMRMRPTVLIGLRLGWAGWIYRVNGWEQDPQSGRSFASSGRAITAAGRLLDAESGVDVGEASASDMSILTAIRRAPIIVPRSANPIVRLSR